MGFTATPRNAAPQDPSTPTNVRPAAQKSARDRAIARLLGGPADAQGGAQVNQAQTSPVPNASSISPEDMIKTPEPTEESTQTDKVVDASSEAEAPATPVTEETSPKVEEPKAEEKPLSNQYAILARKEKQLRAKAAELKAREDAFKVKEASLTPSKPAPEASKAPTLDDLRQRIQSDPNEIIEVMSELGMSYDQVTNLMLNRPNPPSQEVLELRKSVKSLESKLEALGKGQEEVKQSYADSQKQAYDQAVNQIRNEAKGLITSDPKFETIKETNSLQDVMDLITLTFEKDGVLLTVEEAATAVEDHLVEEALKLAKLKKIQARLNPAKPKTEAPKHVGAGTQPAQQQPTKTLTNSMTSSRQLSARDRAIAAFKNQKLG